MAEDFLPIMMFRQRTVDEDRVEGRGQKEKPKWVLTGADLVARSHSLVNDLVNSYSQVQHNIELPYIYEVTLDKRDTAKSKRKAVVDMLEVDGANGPAHVIGMRGSKRLIVRATGDSQVQAIQERLSDYERYDTALSCIDSISRFEPEIETNAEENVYKVRLLDFKDDDPSYERVFEGQLRSLGIPFEKLSYAKHLMVYRIHADSDQVRAVADGVACETLFFIRPMPKCAATLDGVSGYALPGVQKPTPGEDYPLVGVLDSGIERIKHLEPWLEGKRMSTYVDSDLDTRHGTFVAGVAAYGDRLEQKDWVGGLPVRLLDAAVFPGDGNVDELDLVDSIRTIVGAMHDKVKVWNLSISFLTEVDEDEYSEFGMALDDIQDEYGVLICKSAGNCDLSRDGAKGKLLVGADSVRALTVGSAAHEKDIHDAAEIGYASPFSRMGPGPEYIIKPEVCHYGGNAGWTPSGLTRSEVHSFGIDGGPAGAVGTSFSTPRIAALAANLQNAIGGDFDPLLIKALIVHSASFPGDVLVPANERVQEMGFGIPGSIRSILSDDIHSSTLILRGKLPRRQLIDIKDFPMPPSLIRDGYYTGQIILTAVLSPIRAIGQGGEYCQSDIEVTFGTYDFKEERDTTQNGILNPIGRKYSTNLLLPTRYSAPKLREADTDFALRERMLIKYKGKYAPVKKYAIDLADLTPKFKEKVAAERLWFLSLKGTYRHNTEREADITNRLLDQDYCVIITLRDPSGESLLYNEVPQQLEQYNFWHQNIQLTNQVRAMIGQSR